MFSRSVAVNQLLYERNKPVIITTARTNEDTFHVSFRTKLFTRLEEANLLKWYLVLNERCN